MRNRWKMCAAVLLALAWENGVEAQPPGVLQKRVVLEALDLNHDGELSASEITQASQSLLTLDRNGDGMLTANELMPPRPDAGATPDELARQLLAFDKEGKGYLVAEDLPARMSGIFARADANHDGKLTAEEIRASSARQATPGGAAGRTAQVAMIFRLDALLAALDTDHDGKLSATEIAAASASLLTLDRNGDGKLTPEETPQRQQTPEERVNHLLDEFDANHDGRIAFDEAPERLQGEFAKIDRNGDKFLDKDELIAFFASMPPAPKNTHRAPKGGEKQR